jgi:hypothetical protein
MNLNPSEVLDPVFHFLDDAIANYGVYLYLALVWLSGAAIAWIFSGGLRRKMRQPPHQRWHPNPADRIATADHILRPRFRL